MIEILFSEGAAGSIQDVIDAKNSTVPSTDDFYLAPETTKLIDDKMEGRSCKENGNGHSVEKNCRNIACFPLDLSVGDILDPFSDERADFLQSMVLIAGEAFSDVGRDLLETARDSLEKVLAAAEGGVPLRIWWSRNPDEFCGLCHMLSLLPQDADIRVVELPEFEVMGREIRTYSAWNEMDPVDFGRLQTRERSLTDMERRYFAGLWRELQAENGPLRAVVNGRLCTVGADFYDVFLLRELEKQPREFHEARFIGEILGRYPLGISDWLVARRIEAFISRGMLMPATEPLKDHPIYHRYLRKEDHR